MAEARRIEAILKKLAEEYPEAECSLKFTNPYELLMATILSAQCTDERVNLVTPALFKKYPTPQSMAQAKLPELEKLVQSTGFFRQKAKSLQAASQAIVEEHGGKVPRDLEKLTQLRGVGRKTANVILGVAYGVPAVVVDTHVKRLSYRLGFTRSKDPEKIELDLSQVVPKNHWIDFAHLLIYHGREVCTARRAFCERCIISRYCPKVGVAAHSPVPPRRP